MLKKLFCWLWSHSFDNTTEQDKAVSLREFKCSAGESKDYKIIRVIWCNRCLRYVKV